MALPFVTERKAEQITKEVIKEEASGEEEVIIDLGTYGKDQDYPSFEVLKEAIGNHKDEKIRLKLFKDSYSGPKSYDLVGKISFGPVNNTVHWCFVGFDYTNFSFYSGDSAYVAFSELSTSLLFEKFIFDLPEGFIGNVETHKPLTVSEIENVIPISNSTTPRYGFIIRGVPYMYTLGASEMGPGYNYKKVGLINLVTGEAAFGEIKSSHYNDNIFDTLGKKILVPTLPSDASTKTYVLKGVNGTLTWVEETA